MIFSTRFTHFSSAVLILGLVAGLCGCDQFISLLSTDTEEDIIDTPIEFDVGLSLPLTGATTAANDWTNPDNPRCAVFNCYNSIWAQWHRLNLNHETITAMPLKRQSLFRGTWAIGGGPEGNREYSLDNRTV